MIQSFRHRELERFWQTGRSRRIAAEIQGRLQRRLDALNRAARPEDMNLPGFSFHGLQGAPQRYSVHVNGPWCVTFGWAADGGAIDVDFEQYH